MRANGNSCNRIDNSLRSVVGNLTEDRVLAVEPSRSHRGDEELRAVGARDLAGHVTALAGVRHSELVGLVEDELGVNLVVEGVAGAAHTGAVGVAALNHEVLDDAVKDHTIIEALLGQVDEVLDRLRRLIAEKVDDDIAVVRVNGRNCRVKSHSCNCMRSRLDVTECARQVLQPG